MHDCWPPPQVRLYCFLGGGCFSSLMPGRLALVARRVSGDGIAPIVCGVGSS